MFRCDNMLSFTTGLSAFKVDDNRRRVLKLMRFRRKSRAKAAQRRIQDDTAAHWNMR